MFTDIHFIMLKTTWQQLLQQYTSDQQLIDDGFHTILHHYSAPERHYHNLSHLEVLLHLQQQYRQVITDNDNLQLAIFFHDLIYDVKRGDNEEQSAIEAIRFLEQLSCPSAKTAAYIRATKTHINPENDTDLDYFLDFDLSILGAPAAAYKAYTAQIRQEYSIYPDMLYKPGRKKVLQHFLDLPFIYKTEIFRQQYEEQARMNLKEELNGL